MELKLFWFSRYEEKGRSAALFWQKCMNRLMVGCFRYDKGKPIKKAKYLTRLKAELKAYEESGNQEHLVNIANYCFLETVAPQHKKAHWAVLEKSVTRDKLGMKL